MRHCNLCANVRHCNLCANVRHCNLCANVRHCNLCANARHCNLCANARHCNLVFLLCLADEQLEWCRFLVLSLDQIQRLNALCVPHDDLMKDKYSYRVQVVLVSSDSIMYCLGTSGETGSLAVSSDSLLYCLRNEVKPAVWVSLLTAFCTAGGMKSNRQS